MLHSFGYDFVEAEPNEHCGHDLRKLTLFEVGPTLIGANAATGVLIVKNRSARASGKAGRVLSARNETAIRRSQAGDVKPS